MGVCCWNSWAPLLWHRWLSGCVFSAHGYALTFQVQLVTNSRGINTWELLGNPCNMCLVFRVQWCSISGTRLQFAVQDSVYHKLPLHVIGWYCSIRASALLPCVLGHKQLPLAFKAFFQTLVYVTIQTEFSGYFHRLPTRTAGISWGSLHLLNLLAWPWGLWLHFQHSFFPFPNHLGSGFCGLPSLQSRGNGYIVVLVGYASILGTK